MWVILLLLFLALLTSVVISWVCLSHDPFTNVELTSGCQYEVTLSEPGAAKQVDKTYTFPNITVDGKCKLLKSEVIVRLRILMTRVHLCFTQLGIGYHVSGGSLLGVMRHNTLPMPYDDDIDVAVEFSQRDRLFHPLFSREAERFGLQTKFLWSNNTKRADRHGAALRFQLLPDPMGTDTKKYSETCDVFFLANDPSNQERVFKVDGWKDSQLTQNAKEQFQKSDIYPRQVHEVDGLLISLPANPMALLHQQYGTSVMSVAKIRPRLISHAFPMQFLQLLWVNTVGSADDPYEPFEQPTSKGLLPKETSKGLTPKETSKGLTPKEG